MLFSAEYKISVDSLILLFTECWSCIANGHPQNALRFRHHKGNALCYGKVIKIALGWSNNAFFRKFWFLIPLSRRGKRPFSPPCGRPCSVLYVRTVHTSKDVRLCIKQWNKTHSTLRQGSSQLEIHQASRMPRWIVAEQSLYAVGMSDT